MKIKHKQFYWSFSSDVFLRARFRCFKWISCLSRYRKEPLPKSWKHFSKSCRHEENWEPEHCFPVLLLRSCVGIFKGTLGNKEPNSCWMYIHINIFNFLFLFKTKARPHAQECTVQEWPWLQPGTENGRGKEVSEAAAGCCWAVLWAVSVPATGFLSIRWKKPTYHCLWFQLGASLMLAILL